MTTLNLRARPLGSASTRQRRSWSEFLFVPDLVLAVVIGLVVRFMDPADGLNALALLACSFAVIAAMRRGGPYMLPSGVFFIASGVFVGAAAFYLGRVESDVALQDMRNAAALALLTTVATSMVVLACSVHMKLRWEAHDLSPDGRSAPLEPPGQFVLRALILIGLSQVPIVESTFGPVAAALGLAGIVMLVLSASTRRTRMRWPGDLVVVGLAVLAPVCWYWAHFSGGGRITIAGMMMSSFLAWNLVRPHRAQKVAVILCIPVFLLIAGFDRLDRSNTGEEVSSSAVVADGKGLASVYSPLRTFGEIIESKPPEAEAKLGPRNGETFLNTLVLPVPRQYWDDKPVGFGRELVVALEMKGVSEEHSIAGLIQAEWYANFGYGGLILMVPVMGWFLAWLDRVHCRLVRSQLQRARDWWRAVALFCIVSSLADLYWVGTFTFFARGGLAALVALALGHLSIRTPNDSAWVRRAKRGGGRPSPLELSSRSVPAGPS